LKELESQEAKIVAQMAPVAAPAAHPLMKTRRRYAGLSFDGRLVSQGARQIHVPNYSTDCFIFITQLFTEWRASGLDPGPDRRHTGIQGLGRLRIAAQIFPVSKTFLTQAIWVDAW
jgi:hypothetical protein